NKVLDIFVETLSQPSDSDGTAKIEPKKETQAVQKKQVELLQDFSKRLNTAKVSTRPIGAALQADGSILGFSDVNANGTQESSDTKLFKIEIFPEQNQLVATDLQRNYRRNHAYRGGGGFFWGMMLGSMMNRRGSYFSGARASARPRYNDLKMSPKDYHSRAVNTARQKAAARTKTSARSRSGSRSFFGGK
ncbi:MAG: hypothetical protein AAF517_27105, partial [Planctomycetota bacterium]